MGQRLLSAIYMESWVWTKNKKKNYYGDNVDIFSQIYKRGH